MTDATRKAIEEEIFPQVSELVDGYGSNPHELFEWVSDAYERWEDTKPGQDREQAADLVVWAIAYYNSINKSES